MKTKLPLILVSAIALLSLSCGKKPHEQSSLSEPTVSKETTPAEERIAQNSLNTSAEIADLSNFSGENENEEFDIHKSEGPEISFCGLKGSDDGQSYKIFDWETESELWVNKGDDFKGFLVVGMDSSGSIDSLILEKDSFWYLYPMEDTKLDGTTDNTGKVSVLRAEDIPEGVDVMEYVSTHTIPMNSGEMPEDMPVLNPDVDMDAIE